MNYGVLKSLKKNEVQMHFPLSALLLSNFAHK